MTELILDSSKPKIKKEGWRLDDGKKHSNICCYGLKEKPFILWARKHHIGKNFTGITASESRNRMWTACNRQLPRTDELVAGRNLLVQSKCKTCLKFISKQEGKTQ